MWPCGCKISTACNYDADADSCHPDDNVGFTDVSCCILSNECCDGEFNLWSIAGGGNSDECTNYCIEQGWTKGEIDFEFGAGYVDITILDIVMMVNMILEGTYGTTAFEGLDICAFWAADVNDDNLINVEDILQQVGTILDQGIPSAVEGCIDPTAINCTSQECCDDPEYYWCGEEPSEGYATVTDWCMYGDIDFLTHGDYHLFSGCSDPSAINYSPLATFSHSCYYEYGDEMLYSDCRGNMFTESEINDKLNNPYCNYRENVASSDFLDDKMDLYCIGGFHGNNPDNVPYFLWDNDNCPGDYWDVYDISQHSTAFSHQWWLNNWGQRLPYGGRLYHSNSLYLTEDGMVGWHGTQSGFFPVEGIWVHPTNHSQILTNSELPYEIGLDEWYGALSSNTNQTNRFIKALQYTDSAWQAQFGVGNKSLEGVDINYKGIFNTLGWDRLYHPEDHGGKRTVVTVIDTGVDYNHEALKDYDDGHPRVIRKQMPFSESHWLKPYGVFCNTFYHGPGAPEPIEPDDDGYHRFYGWNYELHKLGQLYACGQSIEFNQDDSPFTADCGLTGMYVDEICTSTDTNSGIINYYFDDNLAPFWPNAFDINGTVSGLSPGNHGTFVAGIVAGSVQSNGEGVQGICPSCYIHPEWSTFDDIGSNKGKLSMYDNFIRSDSDIAQHSYGGGATFGIFSDPDNIKLFYDLLRYAVEEAGKIMVNAAGNEDQNLQRDVCDNMINTVDDMDYYSDGNELCNTIVNWHPLTLVIGGIRPDGKKVDFSNYGTRIDVVAPAVHILSSNAQPHTIVNTNFSDWNFQPDLNLSGQSGNFIPENPDVYGGEDVRTSSALSFVNGTSFASPQVSGTAALMISVNPSLVEPDGHFELHSYAGGSWSNTNWQEDGHNWCYDEANNSYVFQCVSNEGNLDVTESCPNERSECPEPEPEEPETCADVCGQFNSEWEGGTLDGYSCDKFCCNYEDCGIDFCQQCGNDVEELLGDGGYCNNDCWWCDLTPSCEYPYDDCVGTCPVECESPLSLNGYSPDECFQLIGYWEYSNYIEFNWTGNPGCVIDQICVWSEMMGTWGCGPIYNPNTDGVIMYGFSCESTMDFKIISTTGQESNVLTVTTSSSDCNDDGEVPDGYQCGEEEEEEILCGDIGWTCTSNSSPDEDYLCSQDSNYCFCDCALQCIDSLYDAWLGDGYCDDGTWGIYFNCEYFDWDGGDCDEIAENSCQDRCDVQAPAGCYCDELCEGYGDCCPDACNFCGYDCGRDNSNGDIISGGRDRKITGDTSLESMGIKLATITKDRGRVREEIISDRDTPACVCNLQTNGTEQELHLYYGNYKLHIYDESENMEIEYKLECCNPTVCFICHGGYGGGLYDLVPMEGDPFDDCYDVREMIYGVTGGGPEHEIEFKLSDSVLLPPPSDDTIEIDVLNNVHMVYVASGNDSWWNWFEYSADEDFYYNGRTTCKLTILSTEDTSVNWKLEYFGVPYWNDGNKPAEVIGNIIKDTANDEIIDYNIDPITLGERGEQGICFDNDWQKIYHTGCYQLCGQKGLPDDPTNHGGPGSDIGYHVCMGGDSDEFGSSSKNKAGVQLPHTAADLYDEAYCKENKLACVPTVMHPSETVIGDGTIEGTDWNAFGSLTHPKFAVAGPYRWELYTWRQTNPNSCTSCGFYDEDWPDCQKNVGDDCEIDGNYKWLPETGFSGVCQQIHEWRPDTDWCSEFGFTPTNAEWYLPIGGCPGNCRGEPCCSVDNSFDWSTNHWCEGSVNDVDLNSLYSCEDMMGHGVLDVDGAVYNTIGLRRNTDGSDNSDIRVKDKTRKSRPIRPTRDKDYWKKDWSFWDTDGSYESRGYYTELLKYPIPLPQIFLQVKVDDKIGNSLRRHGNKKFPLKELVEFKEIVRIVSKHDPYATVKIYQPDTTVKMNRGYSLFLMISFEKMIPNEDWYDNKDVKVGEILNQIQDLDYVKFLKGVTIDGLGEPEVPM